MIKREDIIEGDLAHFDSFVVPYCKGKWDIVRKLKENGFEPKVIAEIGVRTATAALMFMRCWPGAQYIGMDTGGFVDGGIGQIGIEWARKILKPYNAEIRMIDSQALTGLVDKLDFAHCDGDHSFKCCTHDMNILFGALNPGGFLLVDDYDHLSEVRRAVDAWLTARPSLEWKYFKTYRGDILISKKDQVNG
jgi:hypothetical protein